MYGFTMPVSRTQGQEIAQATKAIKQESLRLQQQHNKEAADTASIASSASSTTSSRASLLKSHLHSRRKMRTPPRELLNMENIMRGQIHMGV